MIQKVSIERVTVQNVIIF